MKTLLVLLLLIPSLSWSKGFITCKGGEESSQSADIYNFSINKKELKLLNPTIKAVIQNFDADIRFQNLIKPIEERTLKQTDSYYIHEIVYEISDNLKIINQYELDAHSGFMKSIQYYRDETGAYTWNYKDEKIYADLDKESFDEYIDKGYFECDESKKLNE